MLLCIYSITQTLKTFTSKILASTENDTSIEELRLNTDTSCVERRSHHILWKRVGLLFRSSRINYIRSGTQSCSALNFLVLFAIFFRTNTFTVISARVLLVFCRLPQNPLQLCNIPPISLVFCNICSTNEAGISRKDGESTSNIGIYQIIIQS